MVTRRTTIVFIASLVVVLGIASGMTKSKAVDDEQFVWTPDVSNDSHPTV